MIMNTKERTQLIVNTVACPYCYAQIGSYCFNKSSGLTRPWKSKIHYHRRDAYRLLMREIISNLFLTSIFGHHNHYIRAPATEAALMREAKTVLYARNGKFYDAKGNEVKEEALQLDGPLCRSCGSIMVQTGHCYTCPECGENTGCS